MGLVCALALSACQVNQDNISAADKLSATAVLPTAPTVSNVAYGPRNAHKFDIWRPAGASVGTIIYFHSGGWIAGDKTEIFGLVRNQISKGWTVVSVNHRLSSPTATVWGSSGSVRAPQILGDMDRSIRFIKANAVALGLNVSTLITSGASAGGHLAMMAAVAPGQWVDPTLTPALKNTSPRVDGVLSLVGISDMNTFWQAGGWTPGLSRAVSETFMGCTLDTVAEVAGTPGCATLEAQGKVRKGYVNSLSPAWWVSLASWVRPAGSAPNVVPVYLGYGVQDTLVRPDTQSSSMIGWWEAAAGANRAWYDLTPNAGHNIDNELNRTVLELWFSKLRARTL